MLDFEVDECNQVKLTKAWGNSLVASIRKSLRTIATSIKTMNNNITNIGSKFDDLKAK